MRLSFKPTPMIKYFIPASIFFILLSSCSTKTISSNPIPPYKPESQALHDTLARLDSIFFDSYNTCKLDVFASFIDEDIEFYHDRGGLSTSKPGLVESIKNNICNKVTRELLPGSIEVYPIPDYGAIQMGYHRFFNNQEKEAGWSRYGRFITIWHRNNGAWRISRVVSLH